LDRTKTGLYPAFARGELNPISSPALRVAQSPRSLQALKKKQTEFAHLRFAQYSRPNVIPALRGRIKVVECCLVHQHVGVRASKRFG